MRNSSPAPIADREPPVGRETFVEAMSRAANGVNVVTTDGATGRVGVTVSAATSVTAEPPSLLVCIHHESPAADAITSNGLFCVNVLSASQSRLSDAFAGRLDDDLEDKFSIARWTGLVTGAPVLAEALAAFDCRVDQIHTVGTHRIFIGLVVGAAMQRGTPLVYSHRDYARPVWFPGDGSG